MKKEITQTVQVNEVTLIDNPWQNPYAEDITLKKSFLTAKDQKSSSVHFDALNFLVVLGDEKSIRGRQVYSLIELISEVSGLADILASGAGLFLTFYTAQSQKTEFVEEMASARTRKQHPKNVRRAELDLLNEFLHRFKLRSNFWLSLTSGFCPNVCRTRREVKLLKLHEQANARVEESLDISRGLIVQEDVKLLLQLLFTPT